MPFILKCFYNMYKCGVDFSFPLSGAEGGDAAHR